MIAFKGYIVPCVCVHVCLYVCVALEMTKPEVYAQTACLNQEWMVYKLTGFEQ